MPQNGRVLILDDQEDWRTQLGALLQKNGYYAKAVGTIAKALEELQKDVYHILILDIRMEENNTENEEGITVLEKLKELGLAEATKVIILSAHGTKEHMRTAFQKYEVADFLEKDEPKMNPVKIVQEVFAARVQINLALDIRWQQHNDAEQAVINMEMNGSPVTLDTDMQSRLITELEDLLRRLFYRAKSVLVRPMAPGHSGTGVLWVKPFYINGGGNEVVVKFGDFQKIKNEYQNFNEYVQPYLNGRNTTIIGFRRTTHLGGIIFSLLGDQLENLGDFYRRADTARITATLDQLFLDTCGEWYANGSRLELLDLTTSYLHLLDLNLKFIEQIVIEQLPSVKGKQRLRFDHLKNRQLFTNPFQAIAGNLFSMTTYICITHGDFNQRNLLVDSTGHVWMLNFQGTGEGHILRDVAMLDSVIRFQLLTAEEATLHERWQLEKALCDIKQFKQIEQLSSKLTTSNPALLKAYHIVIHLRTLAGKLVALNPNKDMREYYIALLFNALHTITFSDLSPTQREHALLSASLLADCLESSN